MKSTKNSGRWKPNSAEKTLCCLFILLHGLSGRVIATDTEAFFESWQSRLQSVHDVLTRQLHNESSSECSCSYHDCGTEPPAHVTSCVKSNHDINLTCAVEPCGHAQVSTKRSYMRTPNEIGFGSYPDNVKRDVCFTNGLEDQFRDLRRYRGEGFTPWSYFGSAETGVFRIWPGTRRKNDANGNECAPYDPRVRPWWGRASWKPRKIVILLCLSESMQQDVPQGAYARWELANDMITKFLDTLSENDYVNILVFNMTVEALIPDEPLVQANEDNVERLKQALSQEEPNWDGYAVDIARALKRAFADLRALHDSQALIGGDCDNHILLFTDKRDCVHSAVDDCAIRDRYFENLGGYAPFIPSGTEEFFDFVNEQQQRFRQRARNEASLFSFSLSPEANGMMSQLACRLDGINVDVQRELGNGVTEPLALMKGYFRKAALPIGQELGERSMLVSDFYTDYSGLGQLNTLTMPVFYKPRDQCPPILYGVLGADIPVAEYEENNIEHEKQAFRTAISSWNGRRTACNSGTGDPLSCDLQVIRGSESECVYRLHDDDVRCYRYDDHFYEVNDNPPEEFVSLTAAAENCTDKGGELIAPQTDRERRFLSTIIPADGVWIDLRPGNGTWYWPNGDELGTEQAAKLRRVRFEKLDQAVFMDPRSFDDNFESVQDSAMKFYVCKFDNTPPEEVCDDENTRTITDDDFNNTISTCGLEDCLFSNAAALAYERMEEGRVVCNGGRPNADYNTLACCRENELNDACPAKDSSESDDDYVAFVVICAVIAAVLLFGCLAVYIYRHSSLSLPFFDDASRRKNLLNRPPEMATQMTCYPYAAGTSDSPFDRDAAGLVEDKRPELVVNIEVKLLDNGWEKVGGYGRVRQGEYMDSSGNVHKVAVKFVDALAPNAAWEALKNEFDILALIPMHPNIVRPIGAHYGDRSAKSERYIVEELMHSNLGDLLHGDSSLAYPNLTLTYKHAVNIFIDIATGLEHLHKHKIIHFDLKPKNVLLDQDLRAKIADFGCSKAKFDTYIALSQMGGTPPYMPPECWMLQYSQGSRTEVARAKIDVYSFGVVMWETLNGGHSIGSVCSQTNVPSTSTPREEESKGDANSSDVMVQRWEIKYQLNNSVPVKLRDLVNRCIRADFNARPTCGEILEALRAMLDADWSNQRISLG